MHSGLTLQLAMRISTNVLQEQLRSYWWSDSFVLNYKNALAPPATHCREKSAITAPRAELTVGTVPTVNCHKLRGISSFILLLQQLKWLLSVPCCRKNQQEQISAPGGFGMTQSFFCPIHISYTMRNKWHRCPSTICSIMQPLETCKRNACSYNSLQETRGLDCWEHTPISKLIVSVPSGLLVLTWHSRWHLSVEVSAVPNCTCSIKSMRKQWMTSNKAGCAWCSVVERHKIGVAINTWLLCIIEASIPVHERRGIANVSWECQQYYSVQK